MRRTLPILLLLAACSGGGQAPSAAPTATDAASPPAAEEVPAVARVNGKPLTTEDVRLALSAGGGHNGPSDPATALDGVIRQELRAQRATALGLLPGPDARARLGRMEAQLAAERRKALADALIATESSKKGAPSEEEIRAEFDKNAALYGTDFHIRQILRRSMSEAEADYERLKAGEDFEKVAADHFPGLPASVSKPWELGWLGWHQFPPVWRGIVDVLEPGQHSPVIAGPSGRFWVLQVVAKRPREGVTLESIRGAIGTQLKATRGESWREALDLELRAGAKVERTPVPLPEAATPSAGEEDAPPTPAGPPGQPPHGP